MVGASEKALCDECKRKKREKKIKAFQPPPPSSRIPNVCFLEQGFVCMGPATRAGCGYRCQNSSMPLPRLLRAAARRHRPGGQGHLGHRRSIIEATTEGEVDESPR